MRTWPSAAAYVQQPLPELPQQVATRKVACAAVSSKQMLAAGRLAAARQQLRAQQHGSSGTPSLLRLVPRPTTAYSFEKQVQNNQEHSSGCV